MRKLIGSSLIACVLLLVAGTVSAQDGQTAAGGEKTTFFGIKGGMLMSSTVTVEDFEFDTDASYTVGAFVDYMLAPKFSGGVSFDIHNMSAFDESEMLMDISATLKAHIGNPPSKLRVRPGIGFGYGSLSAIGTSESTTYFLIKAGVEFAIQSAGSMQYMFEAGILAAPSGGNADVSVTYGPGLMLRGGLIF